jgi:hypothetical protein
MLYATDMRPNQLFVRHFSFHRLFIHATCLSRWKKPFKDINRQMPFLPDQLLAGENMNKIILRFISGKNITTPADHSVKFLFKFNVIQIVDGQENLLKSDFYVIGVVSELVIIQFSLNIQQIEQAALSCVISCLKTEPYVKAVVDKEYMLGSQNILNNTPPSMDYETEFPIKWDNK